MPKAPTQIAAVVEPENMIALSDVVTGFAALTTIARDEECRFDKIVVPMKSAVIQVGGGVLARISDRCRAFEVNLWGVMKRVSALLPRRALLTYSINSAWIAFHHKNFVIIQRSLRAC
jgi:hypothetical protein